MDSDYGLDTCPASVVKASIKRAPNKKALIGRP
jgi:hypothetical protein